jgi:hypothetical protein
MSLRTGAAGAPTNDIVCHCEPRRGEAVSRRKGGDRFVAKALLAMTGQMSFPPEWRQGRRGFTRNDGKRGYCFREKIPIKTISHSNEPSYSHNSAATTVRQCSHGTRRSKAPPPRRSSRILNIGRLSSTPNHGAGDHPGACCQNPLVSPGFRRDTT